MTDITFFVPGIPRPGGSKRGFFNAKLKRVIITEDNKRSKDWRASVAQAASEAVEQALDGPLRARFEFVMPRPRGHYGKRGTLKSNAPLYHHIRPDATKLVRSTEDALKGIIWRDDSQIVTQHATKRYGEQPGALITVSPV